MLLNDLQGGGAIWCQPRRHLPVPINDNVPHAACTLRGRFAGVLVQIWPIGARWCVCPRGETATILFQTRVERYLLPDNFRSASAIQSRAAVVPASGVAVDSLV